MVVVLLKNCTGFPLFKKRYMIYIGKITSLVKKILPLLYPKGPRWMIAPRPGDMGGGRSGCKERGKRRRLGKMGGR